MQFVVMRIKSIDGRLLIAKTNKVMNNKTRFQTNRTEARNRFRMISWRVLEDEKEREREGG